jgi:hypothetical protein
MRVTLLGHACLLVETAGSAIPTSSDTRSKSCARRSKRASTISNDSCAPGARAPSPRVEPPDLLTHWLDEVAPTAKDAWKKRLDARLAPYERPGP